MRLAAALPPLALLLGGCERAPGGIVRGEPDAWMMIVAGGLGLLFPHVFAFGFLDDARVVRLIAAPILLVGIVLLFDLYHFSAKG